MTWKNYLRGKTRSPAFLWRMVIVVLLTGVITGLLVDWAVVAWINVEGNEPGATDGSDGDSLMPQWDRLDELADAGQWAALWRAIPAVIVSSWRNPGATFLAVLTGVCWLAFALQAIQPRERLDGRTWLPLLGCALGVLSIWLTVFLIFWQERRWNLVESKELAPGLRFFILGVGLREELSKLLCFLPLLPWCVRRRDELSALILAGCVGIGFAMEENVNYIWSSMGSATLTRLLMPAPFHMAMTGLVGLAAYRACRWPREWGPLFAATFAVAALVHGLYDALLVLPSLAELAPAAYLIFVLLMYQFFRELRMLRHQRAETVSLTANFLFCVSMTAAATFVYLCAAVGWRAAGDVLVSGIIAEGMMVYLFLREMPDTMVTV